MSIEFAPLPLDRLLDWIRRERAVRGTVFGLHQDLFRDDLAGRPFAMQRRGHRLDAPLGVAAGPHTQLSQNLVAAWLCGARHLELKTVQVLDDLTIPRPCIDMADEGYNCEWSQELPIDVSADQYLDAWTAIRVLQHDAGVLDPEEPGFVMDLSVGYDLAGIRSAKVQRFLDRMADSRAELEGRLAAAAAIYPQAGAIPAIDRLADSVTLSTMHGCPPDEIERIARFLIEERGLHTTVKLNPTLLGPVEVRGLLNDTLGFEAEVPDDAFAHDLAWDAALDLIHALRNSASRAGVTFGVKLTNTLSCRNTGSVFPPEEASRYMSGRALHPIAVRTAARLQQACGGDLDISFAGGLDARNLARVTACGLGPATVCSDLLRPGGYQRLHQYLDELSAAMDAVGASDLDAFVRLTAGRPDATVAGAALTNLRAYDAEVADDPAYRKATFPDRCIKTDRALDPFDCIAAPCAQTCPAHQDVPEYMWHTARGEMSEALAVVLRDNPFPTVTGMVCDHPCVERCTRVNYEGAVGIRDVKRALAHLADEPPAPVAAAPTGRRVAVVGAGPAGLSCAWTLALAGVAVTVFEAKDITGGMITDAIPSFRLTEADYRQDLRRIEASGVEIRTGETIDRARLDALRAEYDRVFVGIGAQADRPLGVAGEDRPGVWPALRLLSAVLRGNAPDIGATVAVIGGGNTAMDAARTATRLVAPGGRVQLVYRRTEAEMPAAREELAAVHAEGVEILELLAPESIEAQDGRLALRCRRMRLGAPDASGRPRPEPVPDAVETLVCDTIIPAVGQRRTGDVLDDQTLPADPERLETRLAGVHAGGDARLGPATLIEAIADGRRAAAAMLAAFELPAVDPARPAARDRDAAAWQDRAARLQAPHRPALHAASGPGDFSLVIDELTADQARAEAERCLDCSIRCDVCVSVCPNRANIAYASAPMRLDLARIMRRGDGWDLAADAPLVVAQTRQTCNLVDVCNECGNCATFCPTSGAPYRDKPRIAVRRATYDETDGVHLLERSRDALTIRRRDQGVEMSLSRQGDLLAYETPDARIELDAGTFAVQGVVFRRDGAREISLRPAAELFVLLSGLADHPLVSAAEEV